jgi:hypothetical protein
MTLCIFFVVNKIIADKTRGDLRMKKVLGMCVIGFFMVCSDLFAYGTGFSVFPLERNFGNFTMEYVGFVSNGKGDGFQARYSRRMNSIMTIDGGIGISNSELTKRVFAAADIELMPDYGQMPRVSIRPFFQSAQEYDSRRNIFGATPMISKGFSFWGKEAYPFMGLPIGLVLNSNTRQYEVRTQLALGMAGKLPSSNFENVLVNVEGNFNIQNSYSAVYLGLSFPLL